MNGFAQTGKGDRMKFEVPNNCGLCLSYAMFELINNQRGKEG